MKAEKNGWQIEGSVEEINRLVGSTSSTNVNICKAPIKLYIKKKKVSRKKRFGSRAWTHWTHTEDNIVKRMKLAGISASRIKKELEEHGFLRTTHAIRCRFKKF